MSTDYKITFIISAVVTWFMSKFIGLQLEIQTLIVFMVIDYCMGIVLAVFFKNSNKSVTGAYSSSVGFKGLAKKCVTLMFLVIAYYLDRVLGVDYVVTLVSIAFIVNELASIIENAGLMGIKIPKVIEDVLDVLKNKGE